jgi:hypothetical protein
MSKKKRRARRASSICTKAAETAPQTIGLPEASSIYLKITGRYRSPAHLAAALESYPYMTLFALDGRGERLEVIGVRRNQWIYFPKVRRALYGPRRVFDCYEP